MQIDEASISETTHVVVYDPLFLKNQNKYHFMYSQKTQDFLRMYLVKMSNDIIGEVKVLPNVEIIWKQCAPQTEVPSRSSSFHCIRNIIHLATKGTTLYILADVQMYNVVSKKYICSEFKKSKK